MSDVEKWIEQWRAGLADSETLSGADIRELESHLREETEHLKSLGLSDDESFFVARRRLGPPAAIESEFAKLRPHRWLIQRLCWAILGVLLYIAAMDFAGTAFYLSFNFGHMAGLQQTALGILGVVAQIVGFLGLILLPLWLYIRHCHRRIRSRVRHSRAEPILAAVVLMIGTWVFFVGGRLLMVLAVRTVGLEGFTVASYIDAWVSQICHVAAPTLLAGLFVVLYLRGRREVEA
jgi:uncharacterized membrane protein